MKAEEVIKVLKKIANPEKVKVLQRFFKTGKGEYGEGDVFWGIMVPDIRNTVKQFKDLSLPEIEKLIRHEVHEVRLCGLLLLVAVFKKNPEACYRLYLGNAKYINNWDLVDLTAEHIVGAYLNNKDKKVLERLAYSKHLWEKRIAILSTFHYVKQGKYEETFKIAEILLKDEHDLIHKAVGWMLREVGKRCSIKAEEDFLNRYASQMPRTMLRYAIERFPEKRRKYYLSDRSG